MNLIFQHMFSNFKLIKNKKIFFFLILLAVIFSCKREFLNPCDSDIPDNWPEVKYDTAYVDMNKVVFKGSITKSSSKIKQYGFCWSENRTPTIIDKIKNLGEATSAMQFQVNPDSLIEGKTYHLRSFVTNLSKTVYSNDILFIPQVQITLTNVSFAVQATAKIDGVIKGAFLKVENAEYGVCFATNNNPTYNDTKISLGTFRKDTIFSVNAGNLSNATEYYFKIYCKSSTETKYGNTIKYTTNSVIPVVETSAINSTTQTSAYSGGFISYDGGASITVRGVCWSTSHNPTVSNSYSTDGIGSGSYTSYIGGLYANTTYYVRAYATNNVGTAYGTEISFSTLAPVLPTITTSSISSVTQSTATCGGNVSSDGGATVTVRGVCWSTSQNPNITNTYTTNSAGTGSFTSSLAGLSPNTTYYIRAYATNSVGTAYGNEVSFTTLSLVVGCNYQGGLVAYILQPSDPGYNASVPHGLIVAPSDQSTGMQWWNGSYLTTGANGSTLGTGNANTNAIIAIQGVGNYAAQLCSDLVLGGYNDWYLPSLDELNKLYINKTVLGMSIYDVYWCSFEYSFNNAWCQGFSNGLQYGANKNTLFKVRAVRSF